MLEQGDDDEYLVVSLATGLILVGNNSRIHLGSRWWQRKARKVAVVGRGRPVDMEEAAIERVAERPAT